MKRSRQEVYGGFSIGVYGQDVIESNARDSFGPKYGDPDGRKKAMRAGFVDAEGNITAKGWDVLNRDTATLEGNALAWMKKKFINVRDEGHDRYDDLAGTFWFDTENTNQAHLVEMGVRERIDMTDTSYGDLANTVWKGTSPFSTVLGGAINFQIEPEDLEAVEETLERHAKRGR
jgi:hypothetical protein